LAFTCWTKIASLRPQTTAFQQSKLGNPASHRKTLSQDFCRTPFFLFSLSPLFLVSLASRLDPRSYYTVRSTLVRSSNAQKAGASQEPGTESHSQSVVMSDVPYTEYGRVALGAINHGRASDGQPQKEQDAGQFLDEVCLELNLGFFCSSSN
jgi:hypothetical protein